MSKDWLVAKKMGDGLKAWIYNDFAPWQGYSFWYRATDNELKRYRATYAITVRAGK